MDLLAILGFVAVLLGILGLAGVIATTLAVEIVLIVVGLVLIGYGGRGRIFR